MFTVCPVKADRKMIRLLRALVLCVSLLEVKGDGKYSQRDCVVVPAATEQWKATITLSRALHEPTIVGGEATFIRDDGLYLEITGTELDASNSACVSVSGSYEGDSPVVDITITPVPTSHPVKTREIRSMRVRRAQQVWLVKSVPVTTSRNTLLKAFEPYYKQWGDDSLSGSTKHSSSGSLSVFYAKGSYTSTPNKRGVGWFTTPSGLPSSADDLVLRYDIYFDSFGFGRMGKLPGLYGGVVGDGAYQCSGGSNPSTCFSLRLMWRSGGAGELYAYIPTNQEPGFNNRPDVIANSDHGQSIGRGKIRFQNGTWQTVIQQVHLNTVGKTDGWVKVCNQIRGESQQCFTASNLRIRNSSSHHLRGLFFSTFFGGSSAADAAPNDCHTYYKELSITIPDSVLIG